MEQMINANIRQLLNSSDKSEFKKISSKCTACKSMLCVEFNAVSYCPIFLIAKAKKMAIEKN